MMTWKDVIPMVLFIFLSDMEIGKISFVTCHMDEGLQSNYYECYGFVYTNCGLFEYTNKDVLSSIQINSVLINFHLTSKESRAQSIVICFLTLFPLLSWGKWQSSFSRAIKFILILVSHLLYIMAHHLILINTCFARP